MKIWYVAALIWSINNPLTEFGAIYAEETESEDTSKRR